MSDKHSIHSEDEPSWSPKDVEESLLPAEINGLNKGIKKCHRSYLRCCTGQIISFCLGALFAFITFSLAWSGPRLDSKLENDKWTQNTELRGLVSAPTKKVRFDGTFNRSSPYKGPPSPEVDALWDEVTELGTMSISEDVFQHLNASKHAVKLPSSLGGGRLAVFETIHQIHCVQALWQAAYPEYYTKQTKFKISHPKDWYNHLDHCADMLRQKLMCDADTAFITYNWMKGYRSPSPNFNVQHECRDFNAILEYARDNQVDKENSERIDFNRLKPDDGLIMEFEGEPPFDPDAVPSIRQQ
ncbi:4caf3544-55f1-43c9-a686-2f3867f19e4f [Sclerotinia trifoliorum]|uniref:4caf3544-55f1-43c9-a686-2f3867f19e4f n=1 Tax=Sclerotinia trifoliorum TaxID=28548 RepID=A0A8H2VSR9_9HELO|nr:4caf3544-55f1-43c9-a686-2f3867f19e4f [Sclerotinia trifoliorum]